MKIKPKLVQIKSSNLIQNLCDYFIGVDKQDDQQNDDLKEGEKIDSSDHRYPPCYKNKLAIRLSHNLDELSGRVIGCNCQHLNCVGEVLLEKWCSVNDSYIVKKHLLPQCMTKKEESMTKSKGIKRRNVKKFRNRFSHPDGLPHAGKKIPWPPLYEKFYKHGIFLDECGVGALSWYASCCCIYVKQSFQQEIENKDSPIHGVHDSKLLKVHEREKIYEYLKDNPNIIYHIEKVQPSEIDELGISGAWERGIKRSIEVVKEKVKEEMGIDINQVYLDGNKTVECGVNVNCIEQGDQKYAGISMASILAKVDRDNDIMRQASDYPEFEEIFKKSKGYAGGEKHMNLIKQGVYTCQHRKSYNPLRSILQGVEYVSQKHKKMNKIKPLIQKKERLTL